MTTTILVKAARFKAGRYLASYLGPRSSASALSQWNVLYENPPEHVRIDLSRIGEVSLLDWTHLAALILRLIRRNEVKQVDLDVLGRSATRLLPPEHFTAYEKSHYARQLYLPAEYEFSKDRYRLLGFLESLGTYDALNPGPGRAKVIYPGIRHQDAGLRAWFGNQPDLQDRPTVILGMHRVANKADCIAFLEADRILDWRARMNEEFLSSPLFQSDEVWRVLAHELAANFLDHSGGPGLLSARVVASPTLRSGVLRHWCSWTYGPELRDFLLGLRGGFLELCAADGGPGLHDRLKGTLRNRLGEVGAPIPGDSTRLAQDVIAFAFDELATSKRSDKTWAVRRHALSRVLSLVGKYGGALTVRSGPADVGFVWQDEPFARKPGHLGFEPQIRRAVPEPIRGTQVRLLLPLEPQVEYRAGTRARLTRRSVLEQPLPQDYVTEEWHAKGHLGACAPEGWQYRIPGQLPVSGTGWAALMGGA